MHSIDLFVQNYFYTIRTDSLVRVMHFITDLFGSTTYFVGIILVASLLIYFLRGQKYTLLFIGAIVTSVVVVQLLKLFFDVGRPLNGAIEVTGQSFPSNHATTATVFFMMLIYIFDSHFRSFGRKVFNTLCIFGIFLIAFSRLYLGVHWFSDVFWGIMLGLLISYIFAHLFHSRKN
jgi:membrane-associated phospholipid phosphatase